MRLAVIGTGYVGLVSGVCFADLGNEVVCVDNAVSKIECLNNGEVPIYEPGLKEMIASNVEAGRLTFTSDLAAAVRRSEIIIIAVGTPSLPSGEANLSFIEQAAEEIGKEINEYKVIVVKSTVPVGTNEKVAAIIKQYATSSFDFASVPEFLREGTAITDTMNPDRIIIGTESDKAAAILTELHLPLTDRITVTDVRSAEMIKYASNAFLATKISFINEIANICEKVGADVEEVAKGMGMDRRIGSSFLKAGIGYGGSCFPKDTQALIQIAGNVNYDFKLLKSVVEVNRDQRFNVIRKLETILGDLEGKSIAVWGLSFKPETDDVRDAPAIEVIAELLDKGASVRAYDPIASDNFQAAFDRSGVAYCDSAKEAALGADALCLLTEWNQFKQIPMQDIRSWLGSPNLIDGRNVYSEDQLVGTDFVYYSVGRPSLNQGVREQIPLVSL
ncbi:UDP-glucose dehydrogenase family protein [Paenibacillus xylaniclasticus]|uniref:UDP-glucose dehydrogenase family protein n=1 Tax=Paenibacillus xylaniclasticus TaxID=588083 RepID=UPI000FD90545|nr:MULTISPECIES: UDP-glucose/GDP-mannose dehydrogenase family protein [Paenibacillus]GFN29853.1 UDP-glucose 6-dehydrogenase TuaD [Paenibacillus curdlanolyticus]